MVTINITDVEESKLSEFRSLNGLAADGSDDSADWSNNGISNILYLAFGLGDPNEVNIDRTRLVSASVSSNSIAMEYIRPSGDNLGITTTPLSSEDLEDWLAFLISAPIDQEPIYQSIFDLGDGYERVTLTIPMSETKQFYSLEVSAE